MEPLTLRKRSTKSRRRGDENIAAHQRVSVRPYEAEMARGFIMEHVASADSYTRFHAKHGLSGYKPEQLLYTAKVLHNNLENQRRRAEVFGIPGVRGDLRRDLFEVPIPGFILRSMRTDGPANTRDYAVWFRICACVNRYSPNVVTADHHSWHIPLSFVFGSLFGRSVSRSLASLQRLSETTIGVRNDPIAPKRILLPTSLVRSFEFKDSTICISLDANLAKLVLTQARYAHVNLDSVTRLRSIAGLRLYLLALGVAAQGPWNEVGGKARAIIPASEFAGLFSFEATRAWTLQQNVLRRARLDLQRRRLVSEDDDGRYECKDRLQIDVLWQTECRKVVFFTVCVVVARAAVDHRTKHTSDARLAKHLMPRGDALVIDYRSIRKARGESISQGMVKSAELFYREKRVRKKELDLAVSSHLLDTIATGPDKQQYDYADQEADSWEEDEVAQDEYVHPVDEGDDTPRFFRDEDDPWTAA